MRSAGSSVQQKYTCSRANEEIEGNSKTHEEADIELGGGVYPGFSNAQPKFDNRSQLQRDLDAHFERERFKKF